MIQDHNWYILQVQTNADVIQAVMCTLNFASMNIPVDP